MIIAIAGRAGHGKDEIGKIVDELWSEKNYKGSRADGRMNAVFYEPFQLVKFADGINKTIQAITGLPIDYIMNKDNYDKEISWLKMTLRTLKQTIGQGMKPLLGEDIWLKVSFTRVPSGANVKLTDIRFPIEEDFLIKKKAIMFFVERPGHIEKSLNEENQNHTSETSVDLLDKTKYHHIINDGTREHLKKLIRNVLEQYEQWKNPTSLGRDF